MTGDSVTLIVWSVFAALVAASILAYIVEKAAKTLAGKLLDTSAKDEATAKTLHELGYTGAALSLASFGASRGSRVGRAIEKVIPEADGRVSEKDELLFRVKPSARYYLPDEAIDRSFKKHMSERTTFRKLLAVLIVLLLAALAASGVIRFLGRYASNVPRQFERDVYGTEKEADTLLEEQEKLMEEDIRAAEEAAKEEAEAAAKEASESTEESADGEEESTGSEE